MNLRHHRNVLAFCLLQLGISFLSFADTANVMPTPINPSTTIKLPEGFKLTVFANLSTLGDGNANSVRMMAIGPDGHLYVSQTNKDQVVMLPDLNHDGVADDVILVAKNLNKPQGLAFVNGQLYVANQDGVVKLEHNNQQWPASNVIPVIKNLPTGGHTAKALKLGPDGYLYINVGSSCNVCDESDPIRATLLRYTVDGQPAGALVTLGRHAQSAIWANGLRNTQGFAWHPQTMQMFATNNGADMRALSKGGTVNDDYPPEHLNLIEAGKHYGWPYCWGVAQAGVGQFADPNVTGSESFCKTTQAPAITLPAHSTPIGITFLKGSQFPAEYQSDAIVALHGSWNRKIPSGYELVRVKFKDNLPVAVENFATGWLQGKSAWGRPVDVTLATDGALYVSDDRTGMIYRITYVR
jgi:glucose/arabinose dehydrogenase